MNLLEQLKATVRSKADEWSEEEIELAELCAEDYLRQIARQLNGEPGAEGELRQAKSQAASIGTAGAHSAADLFWEVIERDVLGAIKSALRP